MEKNTNTVCQKNLCAGCMACIEKCKVNAIEIKDSLSAYNAVIDEHKCVKCGACKKVCPNNVVPELCKPISWKEGWTEETLRMNASSGGAASAIMKHFVDIGGYVAACMFKNGEFLFEITNKSEELAKFAGSKYVKSNPKGIYSKIVEKLKNDEKVLFIGLPCQVAALKNFVSRLHKNDNLYTIDLICHGTPSPQILNLALQEKGIDIKKLRNIWFRNKTNFNLIIDEKTKKRETVAPMGTQDMYTHAFLASLDYTENCYTCKYAKLERVADVTLGDSWGSNLSVAEQKKGISLVLCQTHKGLELVENSGISLKKVDIDNAIKSNHQLRHPSIMPEKRELFFSHLNKGFDKAILKCAPKMYYKQKIKGLLIKLKIITA